MTGKPNIFLESHNIINPYSGFGQFNYCLIKNLIHKNKDFDFTVTAKSSHLIKDFLPEVKFKKYFPFHRKKMFRIRNKYDLWHSLNQNSKVEPFYNIPYVMTIHDVIFMEEDLLKPAEKQKRLLLLQAKIDRSNAIIYISEYAKKSTNRYFKIPDTTPQFVIYNGNPLSPKPEIKNVEKPEGLNNPFLFSIGQFMEKKNFHSLIGLIAKLPDFQLVIAGNNNLPYLKKVENEIRKFGMAHKVFFPGKISEDEKHFYYQNCDAFVFPSLHEGFGLPPIEAMAYGKPVFLANKTSLPEIGGTLAFYWDHFNPEYMAAVVKDGLQKIQNDPAYAKKAKKHVSQFNWTKTADDYLEVYRTVLTNLNIKNY